MLKAAMEMIVFGALFTFMVSFLAVVIHDFAMTFGRMFGVTRERGLLTTATYWIFRKVFPKVDWRDDYDIFSRNANKEKK